KAMLCPKPKEAGTPDAALPPGQKIGCLLQPEIPTTLRNRWDQPDCIVKLHDAIYESQLYI
ncbi:MAG: hypothetical protein ABSH38_23705, partial [Verrucomicrobiota bacterium]